MVETSSQSKLRTQEKRRRCWHARAFQLLVIEVRRRNVRWPLEFPAQGVLCAEIVDSVSEQPIATFKSAWGGQGLLTLAGGETFHLVCKGWWRPVWSLVAENGQPLLRLHTRQKMVELLTATAVRERRISLLIMFAWYRVLQAEEDAASAATVAVIAAS